jgi:hypothetical protein
MAAYTSNLTAGLGFASAADDYLAFTGNANVGVPGIPWDLSANLQGAYSFRYQLTASYASNTKIFNPGYNRLDVNYESGSNKIFVYYTTTAGDTLIWKSSNSVLDGLWHNILVNKTATSIDVYHDGVLVASVTTALLCQNNSSTFAVGGNNSNVYMDNVRVWNRSLTSSEAFALPGMAARSGLILEWLFNEGSGTTARDTSGSGNNGSLNNGPVYAIGNPAIKTTGVPLAAVLSLAGIMKRQAGYFMMAGIALSGSLKRSLNRLLTASNNLIGGIAKKSSKTIGASLALNNLIWNGNFENAPPTNVPQTHYGWIDGSANGSGTRQQNGWYCYNGGASQTIAGFDSANAHSGNYGMRVSITGPGTYTGVTNIAGIVAPGGIPVLPNTSYTFTGWMKTNFISGSASGGAYIDVLEMDASQGNTQDHGTVNINTTTGWTQYSVTFVTKPTTASLAIECRIDGTGGAGTLVMDSWFDDFVLQPTVGIIARQMNKSYVAAVGLSANAKRLLSKGLTAVVSTFGSGNHRTNLITNPSFETGIAGWSGGSNIVLSQSNAQAYIGSYSGLMQNLTGNGGSNYVDANPAVIPGVTYTFSAYIKQTILSGNTSMTLKFYDNVGTTLGTANTNIPGNVANWTRFSVTGTAPAGTASCQALFIGDGAGGPYTMYFDAVLFEAGATLGSYFDGSTPPANWTGTPNASTSTLNVFAPLPNKNLTAALGLVGSLVHRPSKLFTATLGYVGTIARQIAYRITSNVWISNYTFGNGTMGNSNNTFGNGTTDALLKRTNKTHGAAVSYAATFSRLIGLTLAAVTTYTGNFKRQTSRQLNATLSYVGKFAKQLQRVLLSASLIPIGLFARSTGKALRGSVTSAAGLFRQDNQVMTGSTTPVGKVSRGVVHNLTSNLSYAGLLQKMTAIPFTAVISAVGVLSRQSRKLFNATTTLVTMLSKQTGRLLAGAAAFAGKMIKIPVKGFAGAITYSGNTVKIILKQMGSNLTFKHSFWSFRKTHVKPTDAVHISPDENSGNITLINDDTSKSLDV